MATTNGASATPDQTGSNSNLGKDEVAWFFVEQYYTTLSKTPEKLHLFYSKRSQFVYGQEAEVAEVSVGRQNIQERIKALDLSDTCKVRISNVDSQSSYDNIVIQVIGETSNKVGDDPKKFVQTFVLAQQPSGYFVLNDILRYLDEEGDEGQGETAATQEAAFEVTAPAPVPAAEQPEAKAESVTEEPAPSAIALDAGAIDQKLEEVAGTEQASTNGDDVPEASTEPAVAAPTESVPAAETASVPDPEETARQLEEEDIKEPEKPADPSPTPVVTRQQPPAPQPAAPAQPPKPMTWASRAAAAAGPKPVVPLPKTATPPAQARPTPSTTTAPAKPAAAPASTADAPATAAAPAAAKESSEWQTAGSESKRHNRPQSISGPQGEKEGIQGYVKYVTEKVQHEDLKAALAQYGELVYFDINRAKSCAFVEFATPAGYQAAVAASPLTVNDESITVEPRRPKAQAYGGNNYGQGRGNLPNRGGRTGFDGGRGGGQGGRGNFGGQRGGRGGVRGGRGGPQAANV